MLLWFFGHCIILATAPVAVVAAGQPSLWQQFNKSMDAAVGHARSANDVIRAVRHAIESRKPRIRYPLDVLCLMARRLSDRTFDRIIFKLTGLEALRASPAQCAKATGLRARRG